MGLQHARLPCPSPTSRVCSNSCPYSWWCHQTISSSVIRFFFCLQSFPALESFQMSQFSASGGQYWSFSFSISPSNEYSGLLSFRIDWFDLLAVQGTLKSLLQHHCLKASILQHSAFLMVHLSHPYSQSYGFSSSHVWMWELDHKEDWPLKDWCFWAVVLEKTLESPLDRKEKDWCWSWSCNTLAIWCEEPIHQRRRASFPDAGKDREKEEKGTTEDEMVGWHHQLDRHELEQAPGVDDGQRSLVCCSSWGCKESEMTEWLNWTDGTLRSIWRYFWLSQFGKEESTIGIWGRGQRCC